MRDGKATDLTGQRFGRLVALERIPTPPFQANRNAWWLCVCDCGREHRVSSKALRSGNSVSCGCYRVERMREFGKIRKKPGMEVE